MPDLAQGYSADVVLAANESVRVSTTGQVTVTSAYGAPAGTTTINANTQTFGPYQVPAKLRVTAVSGTANYAQPAQVPVTANPATGEFSPPVSGAGNGAVVTIAAPDGYDVGDVLTATPSTGWTVTGYQWTRDGVDISGATSSTYTLVSADGGKLIGCRAVDAVYSAFATIPSYAPTLPAGYLSLDSSVLTLDSSVLSLV